MYEKSFGLTHYPLGKKTKNLWDNGQLEKLQKQFDWLLQSPAIGLLTGSSGTGKTAALRHIIKNVNSHRYKIIYQSETDFTRYEIYTQLASKINIEAKYRCSAIWQDIRDYMLDLVDNKNITPIWILDEAQNLPVQFLYDLPSFINFAFDSRDIIVIWLVGLPILASTIRRPMYEALSSRIWVNFNWHPIKNKDDFASLIKHAFTESGSSQTIISDSGISMLYMACQSNIRLAHKILVHSLRLAHEKSCNHIPDDIIKEVIDMMKN